MGGEAAEQVNSIERTTKGRERRSERIGGKEKNASIRKREQKMRSIPLQFVPYKGRNGEIQKD